ncbi:MAG: flagellar FliJ family protein, partial [Rhodospirillales bacterium]|nr:flagellar FliJ family protein [Rhodospirillales bacterium]
MARDLHSLIRLHEWRVEEHRRKLGDLLRFLHDLENRAKLLEAEIVHEQNVAQSSPEEAGRGYGQYAEAAIDRRHRLAESIAQSQDEVVAAREELNKAYRELRKFELAQASRDKREALEELRREQAVLDEVGMRTHMR